MAMLNLNSPLLTALHAAIRQEFGGTDYTIYGPCDTTQKKVAVFILGHWFDALQRPICVAYNMAFYYVPTVIAEYAAAYAENAVFAAQVNRILNYVEKYGIENLDSGTGKISA